MKTRILLTALMITCLSGAAWSGDKSKTAPTEPPPINSERSRSIEADRVKQPVLSPTATFEIDWASLNAGGDLNLSSANYQMKVSTAQSVIGESQSANYKMGMGFWYGSSSCLAKPGDANASGTYSLADVIAIVNYIFNKPGCSPQPLCWISSLLCRGDWNGSGTVSLSDVIAAVNYIFNKPGGPWNALPVGVCCL